MIETVNRIKRENALPVFNQLKWKCSPVVFTDRMVPKYSQYNYYTFQYDRSSHGFHFLNGVSRVDGCMVVERGKEGVVVVDVKKKELLKVNEDDLSGVKHNQILDLNDEGDRWEGDVLKDSPYGWGVLYDKDNQMVYEGFRIGELNVCYGRKYYSDIGVTEYEGEICNGMRWGRGVQYDRNGVAVYDGEWLNNERSIIVKVTMSCDKELLHNRIEELVVSDKCCSEREWKTVDLGWMSSLKSLKVGEGCFRCAKELKVIGMNELESVLIGEMSFVEEADLYGYPDYHFYLKNCPKMKVLKIGDNSFSNYTVCEIENVDALEVIEMSELDGSGCFCYASLELKSLLIHSE